MIVAAHQTMMAPQEVWPTPLYTGVSLVGSSVQNNAGILSGFTSSSYATMPFYFTAGATSLVAVIRFTYVSNGSNQGIWGCVGQTNSFTPFYYEAPYNRFNAYISTNGTSWQIYRDNGFWRDRASTGATYTLKLDWNGSSVKFMKFSGSSWTTDMTATLSTVYGNASLVPQLGTNRGANNPFLGTIDLNYTYLYRDGELWWEGAAGAYRNVKTTYPD